MGAWQHSISFLILLILGGASCAQAPTKISGNPIVESKHEVLNPSNPSALIHQKPQDETKRILRELLTHSGVENLSEAKIETKPEVREWTLLSEADGIRTYQEKRPEGDLIGFRGEVFIPVPLARVAAILSDESIRKRWVDSMIETRVIEAFSKLDKIEYNRTQVAWPFQDRDFVYRVKVKISKNPNAMQIQMKSIEDPRAPVVHGVVRGDITHSIYDLKEVSGLGTRVWVEITVNPKGNIPAWAVNLTQKKWPRNTLSRMRALALDPKLVIPEEVLGFFISDHQRKSLGGTGI